MSYFKKNILHAMAVVYYNKKGVWTSFWCILSASFFHKNVSYLILSMAIPSMSYLFSFSRYQTKCVIKFIFRQLMTSEGGNTKI